MLMLAVAFSGSSRAGTPAGIPDSMRGCAKESDDQLRLACYDREVGRAEKSFGLTEDQQRKLDPGKIPTEVNPQTLTSSVVGVMMRSDGRNVITLENGQTWVQGEAYEQTTIRAGDAVTIRPGLLGALYMYVPSKQRTRVTRER